MFTSPVVVQKNSMREKLPFETDGATTMASKKDGKGRSGRLKRILPNDFQVASPELLKGCRQQLKSGERAQQIGSVKTAISPFNDFQSSCCDKELGFRKEGEAHFLDDDFDMLDEMDEPRISVENAANSISISDFDPAENHVVVSSRKSAVEHDRFIPHRLPSGGLKASNFEKKELLFSPAQFDCKHSVGEFCDCQLRVKSEGLQTENGHRLF